MEWVSFPCQADAASGATHSKAVDEKFSQKHGQKSPKKRGIDGCSKSHAELQDGGTKSHAELQDGGTNPHAELEDGGTKSPAELEDGGAKSPAELEDGGANSAGLQDGSMQSSEPGSIVKLSQRLHAILDKGQDGCHGNGSGESEGGSSESSAESSEAAGDERESGGESDHGQVADTAAVESTKKMEGGGVMSPKEMEDGGPTSPKQFKDAGMQSPAKLKDGGKLSADGGSKSPQKLKDGHLPEKIGDGCLAGEASEGAMAAEGGQGSQKAAQNADEDDLKLQALHFNHHVTQQTKKGTITTTERVSVPNPPKESRQLLHSWVFG